MGGVDLRPVVERGDLGLIGLATISGLEGLAHDEHPLGVDERSRASPGVWSSTIRARRPDSVASPTEAISGAAEFAPLRDERGNCYVESCTGPRDRETLMKHAPGLDDIEALLQCALPQFFALPGISEVVIKEVLASGDFDRAFEVMIETRHDWLPLVPTIEQVEAWVAVHWDAARHTQPPTSTRRLGVRLGFGGLVQLDAPDAACKLLLAAAAHGAEPVAKCATDFAAHGMVEVRDFYLLKGPPRPVARMLDEYCALTPLPAVLQNATSAPPPWPQTLRERLRGIPDDATHVSVLEVRSFEHWLTAHQLEQHGSRLLQCGPETLVLILSLVWGTGFRIFGNWRYVAEPALATLPYRHLAGGASWSRPTLLAVPGMTHPPNTGLPTARPLNEPELLRLVDRYIALPDRVRRVLSLALRRLRDGTERLEIEDRVIDVCIALEALFMEDGEFRNQRKIVSRRGSWYYADSPQEREQARALLKQFYAQRSAFVHGSHPESLTPGEEHDLIAMTVDVENVARASLRDMIDGGRPKDWEASKEARAIRHDPPHQKTDIPSVKSESLSWTLAEQEVIDQALEGVWRQGIDNAPERPAGPASTVHQGVDAKAIRQCRQGGIPYVISVPILLYMAHPKWPQEKGDPLDERTKYYCERDVEKHMRRWQEAADKKGLHRFELPLEEPETYLPENYDGWLRILRWKER